MAGMAKGAAQPWRIGGAFGRSLAPGPLGGR